MTSAKLVNVFPLTPSGGNPAPIVLDASEMSDAEMLEVARFHGLECGYVLPPEDSERAHFRLRFFVPRHEMEMCGHATIGALWLLREAGLLPASEVRIETLSGLVRGFTSPDEQAIRITQPAGNVESVAGPGTEKILDVLSLRQDDLAGPILNAKTSRVKTLIPLTSPETLNCLMPDFRRMEALCTAITSTGLYPFAVDRQETNLFHARQFPKASGYPEDAATGIAACALAFGLLEYGWIPRINPNIRIRQGEAMGRPSEMQVQILFSDESGEPAGCLLGGLCRHAII
jgi:PhzF family phenazine biosynthesis protein